MGGKRHLTPFHTTIFEEAKHMSMATDGAFGGVPVASNIRAFACGFWAGDQEARQTSEDQ